MDHLKVSQELIDFIEKSPSVFHAAKTIAQTLDEAGFTRLEEGKTWNIQKGGDYYTSRNDSSILAFRVGKDLQDLHYQLVASHLDSPSFKLKGVPELEGPGPYLRLNVEGYGGMIMSTWLDRPLSLAGRCLVREGDKLTSRLVYFDQDLLLIPNTPIHFNRKINSEFSYNVQVDLVPLFSAGDLEAGDFKKILAQKVGCKPDQVLAYDLYLVNRTPARIWGYKDEFLSAPKLDNLQSAFASLKAFIGAKNDQAVNIYACFDNEEVGSNSKQGALSSFLRDLLDRLGTSLGFNHQDQLKAQAKSFMVSCDNAHALHPNHPELYDEENQVFMNQGMVIKENASQSYTSDAFSTGVFLELCRRAKVPVQRFANRSDLPGGSTLGNLSNIQVSLHAVDVGFPQLAMHSAYETAGSKDTGYGIKALEEFYSTNIRVHGASEIAFD